MMRTRLAASVAMLSITAAAAAQLALLPAPREATAGKSLPLNNGVTITCTACDADDTFAASELTSDLAARGINTTGSVTITLARTTSAAGREALAHTQWIPAMNDEGYAIVPTANGVTVIGATASGVFYGEETVKQLITGNGPNATLQTATIRDWPAMKYRGVHDDLSRGPVPTLDFQKKQIRTFAAYKINVYSPYFEHTMQYTADPLASPPGGAISPAQARELVAYALKYHVTIIPEQEAFGHLHYMLNWEMYNNLAETPHGNVLAPGQVESLAFTKRMFNELASEYPSPLLHIGGDETEDLGKGATKADVDARGLGAVYLDYMTKIVTTLKPLNRRFLFWGDIAMHDPALVKALPADFKQQTIAVAWEYNPHTSFAPYIKPFTDAGMECWIAPGVNNWSRVWPNYNYALNNIQQFTAQGQASGCTGQLNTIWHDDGETLTNNNWYGILYGAEAAWHAGVSSIPHFQSTYGQVFHGDNTGKINQAQQELMAAHALLKDNFKTSDGSDLLFWVDPWSSDGQITAGKIRPYVHDLRMHAERAIVLIAEARNAQPELREQDAIDAIDLGARRMDLIGLKFQVTDEIATIYASAYALQTHTDRESRKDVARDLNLINAPNGKLQDMRNQYALLRDLYEAAWLKSNRPYFLRNNLARYDYTLNTWFARIDKVRSAQRQWDRSQTIPPAAEVGIPAPPSGQP
jgi:hexosaminidase